MYNFFEYESGFSLIKNYILEFKIINFFLLIFIICGIEFLLLFISCLFPYTFFIFLCFSFLFINFFFNFLFLFHEKN